MHMNTECYFDMTSEDDCHSVTDEEEEEEEWILTPPSLSLELTNIDSMEDDEYEYEFQNLSIGNCDNCSFDIDVTELCTEQDEQKEEEKKELTFDFNFESTPRLSLKNMALPLHLYDQESLELEQETVNEDDDEDEMKLSMGQEKHFDFSIHPNEIRLSEQACIHLLNLADYPTDCEEME